MCVALGIVGACSSEQVSLPPLAEPGVDQSRPEVFASRWQEYVDSVSSETLQSDCTPRLVEAATDVAYQGTVVLLHGFSACPQQYFELAELLAARGFRSLIPLLPGHGRDYPDVNSDRPDGQPGPWTWRERYETFAERINGIIEYADGDHVLMGLSGGGAASLFINLHARDLYDRSLVVAPFFDIAGGTVVNAAVAGIGAVPFVNQLSATPFGSAEPCVKKREQGKAGYCRFEVRHVAGMKRLAHWTRREINARPLDIDMQIIAVEHDNSVSNERIAQLLYAHMDNGKTTGCVYEDGVPHSMFSRYDHPGEDMYWLDSFLDSAVDFVAEGQPFPEEPYPGGEDLPYGRCPVDRSSASPESAG